MANRYWVGGTANWDGTAGTKWALTSGGAGGQAVPTSADDVYFDAASGASSVAIAGGNNGAKSINCTGFTGTLGGNNTTSVAGSITLAAGMTYTYIGGITITATATITSAGKTMGRITFDAAGAVFTLGSSLTISSSGNGVTLTRGTLDLNGFTLSTPDFSSSNSNTREITFGSQNIVLTSPFAATTIINMATATNFTCTGTGGFSRNQSVTSTMVFGTTGGSVTNAPVLAITAGNSNLTITANSWFKSINFTGSTCASSATNINIAGNLTFATGGTYISTAVTYRATGTLTSNGKTFISLTVNGSGITVTCAGAITLSSALTLTDGALKLKDGVTSSVASITTTGTTLKYLESTTAGVQATISDTAGINTVTYLSIKDSNATGGAIFNAAGPTNIDAGNNTNWLFGGGGNMLLMFM
jgi:hypothetical protein